MKYFLKYRHEAEKDLEETKNYYADISQAVVENFFAEFFETVSFIQQEPTLFQIRYRKIRIAPMYRFPYGVHYIIKKDEIVILRVLHYKRYFK
ncbi:type II toxin-antitoxin system RelE/ParE family toxin [Mucilaginibacter achroorhodeus]|uniref:Type II toxin-antitoxin system RelE/ParE family toxin n=1 Tax=Mucilaginibacter achroorhodeus TaxID=2599294 RepID=A0A563UAC7_9SPHI|nr:type II toxin-antitoxin system RelE/ParE family toxin [Mucilaginibacter achroorhodeus]TWR28341.1 type II toxin-antitoxin system RelE/ParE family toxin [Mucilaginibacter achroorhodeus]